MKQHTHRWLNSVGVVVALALATTSLVLQECKKPVPAGDEAPRPTHPL